MTKMKKIKRCPFCGGKADLFANYNRRNDIYYIYVCCKECSAQGAPFKTAQDPVAEEWDNVTCDNAINAWNMRKGHDESKKRLQNMSIMRGSAGRR